MSATIHGLTGGHPFFVGELGRLLAEDARAGRTIDENWPYEVPTTVRVPIRRRLGRLAPSTRHLLRAAAILGPEFALTTLAAMVATPELACLDAIDEARRAGFVEHADVPHRHRFVHALIRDALVADLPSTEQVRLRRAAADALEAAAVVEAARSPRIARQPNSPYPPTAGIRWWPSCARSTGPAAPREMRCACSPTRSPYAFTGSPSTLATRCSMSSRAVSCSWTSRPPCAGKGESALGELDAAEADLTSALASSRSADAYPFVVEAALELAGVLAQRGEPGDAERAVALLEDAEPRALELGMVPWIQRTHRLSARATTRRDDTAHRAGDRRGPAACTRHDE